MIRYAWRVFGVPKGQPRPRAYRKKGRASVYDPGTASAWKERIKDTLASEGYPDEPLVGPVRMQLLFQLPRPGKHYSSVEKLKQHAPSAHVQKPDVDNLSKAVMDALTDLGVFTDDCLVVELNVRKLWSHQQDAGVVINLEAPY